MKFGTAALFALLLCPNLWFLAPVRSVHANSASISSTLEVLNLPPHVHSAALNASLLVFEKDPYPFIELLFRLKKAGALPSLAPYSAKINETLSRAPAGHGNAIWVAIKRCIAGSGLVDEEGDPIYFVEPLILWFSLEASIRFPKVLDALWDYIPTLPNYVQRRMGLNVWVPILQLDHWKAERFDQLVQRTLEFPKSDNHLVAEELIEKVAAPQKWHRNPERKFRNWMNALARHPQTGVKRQFIKYILSDPYWLEDAISLTDRAIATRWIDLLLSECLSDGCEAATLVGALYQYVLLQPKWASHPRYPLWIRQIVKDKEWSDDGVLTLIRSILVELPEFPVFSTIPEFMDALASLMQSTDENHRSLFSLAWGWKKLSETPLYRDHPKIRHLFPRVFETGRILEREQCIPNANTTQCSYVISVEGGIPGA